MKEFVSYREVQESDEPEVNTLDIEVVKFRASFANQAPQNGETASMFLDETAECIFLLKQNHKQKNEERPGNYTRCRRV